MKRELHPSTRFIRDAKRLAKYDRQAATSLEAVLQQLCENAFHPSLKTHKLKGELEGLWACSAAYDLRVIFRFAERDGVEVILLQTIGQYQNMGICS